MGVTSISEIPEFDDLVIMERHAKNKKRNRASTLRERYQNERHFLEY
jgi:hypothetical protein